MTATPPPSLPGIPAVEAALRLLDPAIDPVSIAAGQPDSHRHTALLAHLAALANSCADAARRHAGLPVETLLGVHLDADVAAGAQSLSSPEQTLIWLQLARIRWTRSIIYALRGNIQHPIADACLASLDAVTDLLRAWQDATPHRAAHDGPVTGERVKVAPILEAMRRLVYAHGILKITTSRSAGDT